MAKKRDLTKPKTKIIKLPVSKFIDTKYRDYAVYVLEARGIPSFYDALTPVQRFILKNSPSAFNKSLTVVGKCIQDGYHHGDCIDFSSKINLAGGGQITIGDWYEKYPDAQLLILSKDDKGNEIIDLGHSPRVGQETDEYYEIELENGEIIKCTANHKFFVNGKWKEAKNLDKNDDI